MTPYERHGIINAVVGGSRAPPAPPAPRGTLVDLNCGGWQSPDGALGAGSGGSSAPAATSRRLTRLLPSGCPRREKPSFSSSSSALTPHPRVKVHRGCSALRGRGNAELPGAGSLREGGVVVRGRRKRRRRKGRRRKRRKAAAQDPGQGQRRSAPWPAPAAPGAAKLPHAGFSRQHRADRGGGCSSHPRPPPRLTPRSPPRPATV